MIEILLCLLIKLYFLEGKSSQENKGNFDQHYDECYAEHSGRLVKNSYPKIID